MAGAGSGMLASNVQVYSVEKSRSLVVTPTGHKFYVSRSAEEIDALLSRCDGTVPRDELFEDAGEFAEFLTVLEKRGCLQPCGPLNDPRFHRLKRDASGMQSRSGPLVPIVLGESVLVGAFKAALECPDLAVETTLEALPGLVDDLGRSDKSYVVVALYDRPAHAELRAVEQVAQENGLAWMPLRCEFTKVIIGPCVLPDFGVTLGDVLSRRHAASLNPGIQALLAPAPLPGAGAFTRAELTWAAATAANRVERWTAGSIGRILSESELEMDPVTMTTEHRHALPMPDGGDRVRSTTAGRAGVVDVETGIVNRIRVQKADGLLPPRLRSCVADLSDMRRLFDWPNDRQAFGTSWDSEEQARGSAIGEALERYCGNWLPPAKEVRYTSYERLVRGGDHAIDPDALVLYSEEQYSARGFPFVPFRRDSECAWIEGYSHTNSRSVWVPAFLVYVMWHEKQAGDEPRYGYPNLAGIATGETEEYALTSGLEEVLERDSSMVWWANAPRLERLPATDELETLMEGYEGSYDASYLWIANQFSAPVIACALYRNVTDAVTIGFAVRPDPIDAAKKALAEANTLQSTARTYLEKDALGHLTRLGMQSFRNLKPHRTDRLYMDSYRPDFKDVVDLQCQGQINLDPRAKAVYWDWVYDTDRGSWDRVPDLKDRSFASYHDRLRAGVTRSYRSTSPRLMSRQQATRSSVSLCPG